MAENKEEVVDGIYDDFFSFNPNEENFNKEEDAGEQVKFFTPDPEKGNNDTYTALVRFHMNVHDPKNPFIKKFSYLLEGEDGQKFNYDSPKTFGKYEFCVVANRYFKEVKGLDKESEERKKIGKILKRKNPIIVIVEIIKDLHNPENDGLIFPMRATNDLIKKIMEKTHPSAEDIELGEKPINVFDPFDAPIMKLKVTKGDIGRDWSACKWEDKTTGTTIIEYGSDGKETSRKKVTKKEKGNKAAGMAIIQYFRSLPFNITESFGFKESSEEDLERVNAALDHMLSGDFDPDKDKKKKDGKKSDKKKAESKDNPKEASKQKEVSNDTDLDDELSEMEAHFEVED